jgi:anti-sigma B factor antagonist
MRAALPKKIGCEQSRRSAIGGPGTRTGSCGKMSLEIIHREHEGIEILDLSGKLTFGQENLDLQNELDRLVEAGKIRVVLNLSDLRELDTTGVGTLFFALAKLRKAGGKLALLNMKPSQMEVPVEANLETFVEVFQNEPDAINSFFPEREVKRYDVLEFLESNLNKSAD